MELWTHGLMSLLSLLSPSFILSFSQFSNSNKAQKLFELTLDLKITYTDSSPIKQKISSFVTMLVGKYYKNLIV